MKKLYMLIAAMLIFSVSFAQISTTKKVVKKDGTPVNVVNKPSKQQQQRSTNAYWFNLIEDAYDYYGVEADGFAPYVVCDTNNLMEYNDGSMSHVQFCSVGQVYDFDHSSWNTNYNYSGAPENIPYMPSATSYSIDSIQLIWYYGRGTNVPDSIVDTVAISYVIGLQTEGEDKDISYVGYTDETSGEFVPVLAMPFIPYNHATYMASTNPDSEAGFSNTLQNSTILYDKIPLTVDDTTNGHFYVFTLPTPEGMTNLSQKQIVITCTFIPGNERTPTSVIGEDLNAFRTALYDDPRDGYSEGMETDEVLDDYQIGLFHDADNFKPSSIWYPIYQPNNLWQGNPKPSIGVHVICNDCETVNVPEIEKNNPTIYPNPATNNFTVNLGNDEKANIQLFNIVGQQVYSETITGTAQVNVANLNSGVYMLKINQNGKVYTTKVIVK